MTTNKDVQIKLVVDNSKFTAGMNSARDSLARLASSGSTTASQLSVVSGGAEEVAAAFSKAKIAIIAVGTALVAAGGYALKAAANMQSLRVSMQVLAGGEQIGNELVDAIKRFADVTPYATEGLAKNAQILMAYGVETEKVIPTIKLLSDVATGNQEKMNSLALAYGQVTSEGRLLGQDLRQMTTLGFNPLMEISKATGKSMSELKDMMSKGAISTDLVTLAFQRATAEGGKFEGMTSKMGQTLEGRFSTLKDTFQNTAIAIGNVLMPAVAELIDVFIELGTDIQKSIERFNEHLSKNEEFKTSIALVVGTLKETINVLGILIGALKGLYSAIGAVIPGTNNLAKTVVVLAGNFQKLILTIQAAVQWLGIFSGKTLTQVGQDYEKIGAKWRGIDNTINQTLTGKKPLVFDMSQPKKGVADLSLSVKDLDKQIKEAMSQASGTGKGKKTKKAKDTSNQEISDYKQVIDAKTKLLEQFEQLQLSLTQDNSVKRQELELEGERKKQALLISELQKFGISRSEIENVAQDQLYEFDLSKYNKVNKEKLLYLTEHLNQTKININNHLEQVRQAELSKQRETLSEKTANDDAYYNLQKSKIQLQRDQRQISEFEAQTQLNNLELEMLQQRITQETDLLQQFGLTKEEIARLTTDNINNYDLSKFSETQQKQIVEHAQKYQQFQAQANNANGQISSNSYTTMKSSFDGILSAGKSLFSALTDSGQNWGERMFNICNSLISMITNVISLMNSISKFSGGLGGGLNILSGFGGIFAASGAILPGNYSQAIPVVAHGSEMILNPTQQARLFSLANGTAALTARTSGNTESSNPGQPVIIFNQTFSSLEPATAAELVKNQMPYVKAQVLEAINTQSSFRGAIKKAVK